MLNLIIIVKNTGSRYVPVSFNQNLLCVVNRLERLVDGYGNESTIYTPAFNTLVGAWDQTYEVKIVAESEVDREEIADIVQVTLMGTRRMDLQKAGVFIKGMSTSGENEQPYANDFIYTVSVNLDVRTEWRVHIPISNLMERIGLCMSFRTLDGAEEADALSINEILTQVDLL